MIKLIRYTFFILLFTFSNYQCISQVKLKCASGVIKKKKIELVREITDSSQVVLFRTNDIEICTDFSTLIGKGYIFIEESKRGLFDSVLKMQQSNDLKFDSCYRFMGADGESLILNFLSRGMCMVKYKGIKLKKITLILFKEDNCLIALQYYFNSDFIFKRYVVF